jgi:hypothetical protein
MERDYREDERIDSNTNNEVVLSEIMYSDLIPVLYFGDG